MRERAKVCSFLHFMKPDESKYGWIPEWPKGTDCKSAATCFGGSNPPPPTQNCKTVLNFILQMNRWDISSVGRALDF